VQVFGPGVQLLNGYGMTETTSAVVTNVGVEFEARPDSVGRPNLTADLRVVDTDGKELDVGEIGELCFRSPQVVKGYWNDDASTRASFDHGWFRSGDVGYVDADGYVYVVDRLKDVVIRGGENVYCAEVEAVLHEHPDVADVAVVGLEERAMGERVCAVVVPRAGAEVTLADLREFASTRSPRSSARRRCTSPTSCPGRPPRRSPSPSCARALPKPPTSTRGGDDQDDQVVTGQVVTPTASPKSSSVWAIASSGSAFQMFSAHSSAPSMLPVCTASAIPAIPGWCPTGSSASRRAAGVSTKPGRIAVTHGPCRGPCARRARRGPTAPWTPSLRRRSRDRGRRCAPTPTRSAPVRRRLPRRPRAEPRGGTGRRARAGTSRWR
jgi:hypothetical protein